MADPLILRLFPCLPLVPAAYLVAMAGSTVATGHRAAPLRRPSRRGRSRDQRGAALPRTRRLLSSAGCPGYAGLAVTTGARRAGPREHGR
ncbi:MAG: hypothetical protein LC808_34615, partial [Actinobacteria bacterium]|nr:hypothetical protein [Actinomycetota bacterium]